jgi:hypothetical protein
VSEDEPATPQSRRGGARPGAGRKKKNLGSPTAISEFDFKQLTASTPPAEVDPSAQRHAHLALRTLVALLLHGSSEPARISAACRILDRGYGKPAVDIGGDAMLPFMAAPAAPTLGSEIRTEARKFAELAIEVLRRIAEFGQSESARDRAAGALLDRGLGTVAPARMPDQFNPELLGKKEQARRAADAAATGRYAPRPAPRTAETIQ